MGSEHTTRPTQSRTPATSARLMRAATARSSSLPSRIGNQAMGVLLRAALNSGRGPTSVPGQAVPPSVHETLQAPGSPLDASTRADFETRFATDLGAVRIHNDAQAAQSAADVDAAAYTVGRDIIFGAGRYAPATEPGRGLLAHELTHVAQQGQAAASSTIVFGDQAGIAEREAHDVASRVNGFEGPFQPHVTPAPASTLQRQEAGVAIPKTEAGSTLNAISVVRLTPSFFDDAFRDYIENIKEQYESFDEERLKTLARDAFIEMMIGLVPVLAAARRAEALVQSGTEVLEVLDRALHADTEEKQTELARMLAAVAIGAIIATAIGKLGGAIRRKVGSTLTPNNHGSTPHNVTPPQSDSGRSQSKKTPSTERGGDISDLDTYRPKFGNRIKEELASDHPTAPYRDMHDRSSKHRLISKEDTKLDRRHEVPYSQLRDEALAKLDGLSNRERAEVLANSGPGFRPKSLSNKDIKASIKSYLNWLHDDYDNVWVGDRNENRARGATFDQDPDH